MLGLYGFDCFHWISHDGRQCGGSERRPLSNTCWVAGGDLCPPSSWSPGGLLAASLVALAPVMGLEGEEAPDGMRRYEEQEEEGGGEEPGPAAGSAPGQKV